MSNPPDLAPAQPVRYSGRIRGLDIARALAILGMFYAHLVLKDSEAGAVVKFLQAIPDGRSSILFSLLAGVSLAILTGRNVPYSGNAMRHAQLRIVGRALILIAAGAILTWFGTPVIVILGYYGFWFLFAVPFLRWGPKRLFVAAGVLAVVGPMLAQLLVLVESWQPFGMAFEWAPDPNRALDGALFAGASYPGLQYMAFVLAGLAIGRLDITSKSIQRILLLRGSGLALLGYSLSSLLTRAVTAPGEEAWHRPLGPVGPTVDETGSILWPPFSAYTTADPHTGTTLEAIGSGGFAIAVLALCLMASNLGRHVLYPLAALGSMSLTAYSAHIVAMAIWPSLFYDAGHGPFLLVSIAIIVACSLWKLVASRGPLEWVVWKFSLWFAALPGDDAEPLVNSQSRLADRPDPRR